MAEIKILVVGVVGAGKTTAIRSISDTPVVSTEAAASDEVRMEKETTTVAMDYGQLTLDGGEVLKIYGAPGQDRFSFMWDILADGALGLILLLNDQREKPLEDLDAYLGAMAKHTKNIPLVIGVTHVDGRPDAIEPYHAYLERRGATFPVFPLDARNPGEVRVLVEAMAASIEA